MVALVSSKVHREGDEARCSRPGIRLSSIEARNHMFCRLLMRVFVGKRSRVVP